MQGAILAILGGRSDGLGAPLTDRATGASWLIRILSQRKAVVGILAIELGHVSQHGVDAIRQRVDAALAEAAATLERIDVAHAIGEAKLRSEAETLRAALIGSVSHELGTPLTSILGSASVLAQAPSVIADARLASLVDIIRGESERLNTDIQNLLDANASAAGRGRISGRSWYLFSRRRPAAPPSEHRSTCGGGGSGVVRIDPVLAEQALRQGSTTPPSIPRPDLTAGARAGASREIIEDQGAGRRRGAGAAVRALLPRPPDQGRHGLWAGPLIARVRRVGGQLEADRARGTERP